MALVDLNDSIIAQVRSAADIVEFVGQVTPLKQAGKSFKGICPFHREKTPSFHVDRDKGLFYCFGCGAGGDVFKFLSLTERFTFPEAVEHVAQRVGIELPRRRKTTRENEKDDLFEVLDDASEAFHQAFEWKPNAADEYVKQRGVPAEMIRRFGFGYAPDSWDYVLTRLARKHGEAKLDKAGLVMPRKGGTGFYDRFRNRLMIPIHSETGQVIGFGGRTLDGSEPKYLNSPESEVFNKSRLLFNLHRAKDQMRRQDRAILVEGYFDAMAIDQAGVPGVVASMGTSLTPGQASVLKRYARNVVLSYDGDAAGRAATLRGAPILLAAGLNVHVLDLGDEKDPDTLIQNKGIDRFFEALGTAKDIIDFALREWAADAGALSGREKAERIDRFVPLLSAISDPVIRNDAAQRIADAFRLEFDSIWSRVKGRAQAPQQAERQQTAPGMNAEKMLLAAAIQGRLPVEVAERVIPDYVDDAACRKIWEQVRPALLSGEAIDFTTLQTHLRGEAELTLLSELSLSEDVDDRTLQRIDENLRPLEKNYLDRRYLQIQKEIADAQRAGDEARIERLFAEKIDLSRRFSSLK